MRNDNVSTRFFLYIKNNFAMIIFFAVIGVYLFRSFVEFDNNERDITEILIDIAWNLTLGVYITITLGNKGVENGTKDDLYLTAFRTYGNSVADIDGKTDNLKGYCDEKNRTQLISHQRTYLRLYGISYDVWINGGLDVTALTKSQKRAIKKVNKIKILEISPEYLLSNCETDITKLRKIPSTKGSYRRKRDKGAFLKKVIPAVMLGWYSMKLVQNPQVSLLIEGALKMGFWLLAGILQYTTDYNFIVDDYRDNVIIRKTNYLIEYKTYNEILERERAENGNTKAEISVEETNESAKHLQDELRNSERKLQQSECKLQQE